MRWPGALQTMVLVWVFAWTIALVCHYLDADHTVCHWVDQQLAEANDLFSEAARNLSSF